MIHLRYGEIRKIIVKIIIFFTFIFFLQALINFYLIQYFASNRIKEDLAWMSNRISNDLRYIDNKWDTSVYSADPLTPHPDGTGGFPNPIYIITKTGYVIERNLPIRSYLDTASLTDLLTYQKPQTITGETYEKRRIIAKPIMYQNKIIGGIGISVVVHTDENTAQIDSMLNKNIERILSKIRTSSTGIDMSFLEVQALDYNISFEIISIYNEVLLSNGRIPSTIDRSYFQNEISMPEYQTIRDTSTHEQFLIHRKTIYDKNNSPILLIVNAKSFSDTKEVLISYIITTSITYIVILLPLTLLTFYLLRREVSEIFTKKPLDYIRSIQFDTQSSTITVDGAPISLPEDSQQAHFATILFSDTSKKWSEQYLMDTFRLDNARSIYDTALIINKKTRIKLISYDNHEYSINHKYISCVEII